MLEYKINELFQWEDRTLMCVEGVNGDSNYFTNKLIFSAEGIKLQIKRKGCKVKVKVLELYTSEDGLDYECAYFDKIDNDKFTIYKSDIMSKFFTDSLSVHEVEDKVKHKFYTEQEAIDWVEALFSLRGE